MLNRFSSALANVERALRALEEDCYGDCIRCATPIPMKRLQTIPWAAFCERCRAEIRGYAGSGVPAPDFNGPRGRVDRLRRRIAKIVSAYDFRT